MVGSAIYFCKFVAICYDFAMHNDLKAILKNKGYSLTEPRKVVFDLLLHEQPQTMSAVLKKAGGKVDRASVYRVIDLYEKLGIVHRLNIGFKYKLELSDVFHSHHHHFYCTNCGQTYELPANPMLEAMITSAAGADFAPRGHHLEIYGLCSSCAKR